MSSVILAEEYPSTFASNDGDKLDEELLLHLSLMMRSMECDYFRARYKFMKFPKFHDVVLEFTFKDVNYLILIQTKFVLNKDDNKITIESLLSKKDTERFNLSQYLSTILNAKKEIGEITAKFILLTTSSMDSTIDITSEDNTGIEELFSVLVDEGAKVSKLGVTFENVLKNILLQANLVENLEENIEYIRENFLFVTDSPYVDKLIEINNDLLNEIDVNNKDIFFGVVRKNLQHFISLNLSVKEKERKVLTDINFSGILKRSALQVDLPKISQTFFNELPLMIKFEENIVQKVAENFPKDCNIIARESATKLDALRIHQTIKSNIILPTSMIKQSRLETLEFYDENIVIFVDVPVSSGNLPKNKNLYFIGKINEDPLRCERSGTREDHCNRILTSYERPSFPTRCDFCIITHERKCEYLANVKFSLYDLSQETLNKFFECEILLQNSPVPLRFIARRGCDDYKKLMERIFWEIFEGKVVTFGDALSRKRIPASYIERKFQENDGVLENIPENGLFSKYYLCIVTGSPGMGKSCTLEHMGNNFKELNPHFWIEFFELRSLCNIFSGIHLNFTEDDAKTFLIQKLLTIRQNNEFDRNLLDYYLSLDYPPIILIFDGYDEIMPTYDQVVCNFISKLICLNVRIYITGRPHSLAVLRQLDMFNEVEIVPLNDEECDRYVREYFKIHIANDAKEKTTFDLFSLMKTKAYKEFYFTPLYLELLAKIAISVNKEDSQNSQITENINSLWLYEKIVELSVDKYLEKSVTDLTFEAALVMKRNELLQIYDFHAFFAAQELKVPHFYAPHYDIPEDPEILAQGFLKLNAKNEFTFIHRTFAEYFLACGLIGEIERSNMDVLEYIYETQSLIFQFICQIVVKKILAKTWNVNVKENLDEKEIQLFFYGRLVEFCWNEDNANFGKVLECLWKTFADDTLKHFNFEQTILLNKSNTLKEIENVFLNFSENHNFIKYLNSIFNQIKSRE